MVVMMLRMRMIVMMRAVMAAILIFVMMIIITSMVFPVPIHYKSFLILVAATLACGLMKRQDF